MSQKRLYRSRTNRVIAGVCGGLGEYFGIDPIIFRLIFLFVPGVNLIYFILWIFAPNNPNQKGPNRASGIWKILIVLFFILPIIFATIFFVGSYKFITSQNSSTVTPFNHEKSATELVQDANNKVQQALQLQNKGHLTDIESKQKITLITDAIAEYKQATQKDPLYIDAWQNLGVINKQLGDAVPSGSLEQVELYNEAANAYYNLGQVYLQKGQKDQGKMVLQLALKIVPSSNPDLRAKIQQALNNI